MSRRKLYPNDLKSFQKMTGIDQVPPGTNIRNYVPEEYNIDFESPGSFFDTDDDDEMQTFPTLGVEPCRVKNEGVSSIDDRTFSGWRKFSIPGKDFSDTPVEFMVVTSTIDAPMFHIRIGVMKLKDADRIAKECIAYCRLVDNEKNSLLHHFRGKTLSYRDWTRVKMNWHRVVEIEDKDNPENKPQPIVVIAFEKMTFDEKEKACRKLDFCRRFVKGEWIQCEKSHENAQPDFQRLKEYMKEKLK